ncbi:PA2169 family four-helix-bundle protein [Nocardioides caeni]|uniref:PA2169 family four-helix-bundle protein n=1 Tax=Nocardioides caeni TaxID=574700 RepID=A0A4S8N8B8_9ACTN|nr:PA2169 family four-helix-bundle protein [Nocardioides caeni]THV11189.1 PA2169 family four-helix-bundle protein [Nocardioides caeni]
MTEDNSAAKELVETLRDGERGYASAAEKLRSSDRADWATTLQRFSEQRSAFRQEIVDLGHRYDEDVDQSGTAAAALHRGWIALKDALTGDDAGSVLGACVTGENHAVSEYEKALGSDLSAGFREVVTRQHAAVVAARDEVAALQGVD